MTPNEAHNLVCFWSRAALPSTFLARMLIDRLWSADNWLDAPVILKHTRMHLLLAEEVAGGLTGVFRDE